VQGCSIERPYGCTSLTCKWLDSETRVVYYASLLRDIAEQCGLTPIRQIARQPGIQGVYRITVRYADRPRRYLTATLRRSGGPAVLKSSTRASITGLVYSIDEARTVLCPDAPKDRLRPPA
jgi:hypothetical protein